MASKLIETVCFNFVPIGCIIYSVYYTLYIAYICELHIVKPLQTIETLVTLDLKIPN